ncbi:peptidase M14 [Phaeovulum sp.]|uniref:peptidase M14 n=1 Tax=Phaeovulum sp. TaxID=2934796 RepID=UPI0039E22875
MTPLIEKTYDRTLYNLPADCSEVWLFEGIAARQRLEQARGFPVRSAYKTLLHDVLERDLLRGVAKAVIHYPVLPGDEPLRFRLECYPLGEMCQTRIEFQPASQPGDSMPHYRIEREGLPSVIVPVPVRQVTLGDGSNCFAACGWMRRGDQSAPLETDYEKIFRDVTGAMNQIEITDRRPIFDQLIVDVTAPFQDLPLPVGKERISLAEALHEDVYFAAIEVFQACLGLEQGARDLQHGQVVPLIRIGEKPSLKMWLAKADLSKDHDLGGVPVLHDATHWLTPRQIDGHLDEIGGTRFETTSRQGRPVAGIVVNPEAPVQLAISSGQHSNETSPVVGALRAGYELRDMKVGFTLCPMENPDGYALFRRLCRDNESYMHHAARYTAGGNDLSFATGYESRIRQMARERLPADVHVNLHGYPSHEWTRPLSGYVPRGFARWTLPKGFFLICRHHPGWGDLAKLVVEAAITAIAGHPEQMRQNAMMMRRYLAANPTPDFEVARGCIPHSTTETESEPYPVALITEAPDETIDGEDFRIAQESQYRVVLEIARALQSTLAHAPSKERSEEPGTSQINSIASAATGPWA